MESLLFSPLRLRRVTLKNRIAVSPMCQYSSEDGFAGEWHFVHLGSRAVGGAGLIIAEATAIEPVGRITAQDLGLWKAELVGPLARIVRFVSDHGAVPGIQLAHAGRKASTNAPWKGERPVPREEGGWSPVAPSPLPYAPGYPEPEALDEEGIHR